MSSNETLAVVIPHHNEPAEMYERAMTSAKNLQMNSTINHIEIVTVRDPSAGVADLYNAAIDRALELSATWIFFLKADECIEPNALTYLSAALDAYNGLWGGINLINEQGEGVIAKQSLMSSDETVRNYHTALNWWIGKSHFVRTDVAVHNRFDASKGEAWYADYLTRVWKSARSLKSAQALTSRTGNLPMLSDHERHFLLDDLEMDPKFVSFRYADQPIQLPFTGRNPTLERVQLRGLFYEQSDLQKLTEHVKPGAVCIDVGANTGNHTVFFAKVLKASKVIPIEPNPDAVRILKRCVAVNELTNVDCTKLGVGVGKEAGQFDLNVGRRGHLGTARLSPNDEGTITVQTLDALITEAVQLIKIDVEMMEIDVLEGARNLIGHDQPVLLIEAQDENITPLLAILDDLSYRIEKVFPDQGYANYLALPRMKA